MKFRPMLTAGLRTPADPRRDAMMIPISRELPTTMPDMLSGALPVATEATPKAKKKVPTVSAMAMVQENSDPETAAVMPIPIITSKAIPPPTPWAKIYLIASLDEILLIEKRPSVMAGLIWAPEIEPME